MEEDTGKTSHVGATGRIHGSDYSLVDYNRSGVPLVETVSKPDITSAEQARAYVSELRAILVATGASDGKMEEGSLRVDANVSIRPVGATELGTRCEIKNLNSLRSLGRAIEHEAKRQAELLDRGESVVQETRHWDENKGKTQSGRSKEEAYDYRYFPEPDLVPIAPDEAWRASVAAGLPVLPAERRVRLAASAGVTPADVAIVVEQDLDVLVNAAIDAGGDAKVALKRAANEVAGRTISSDAFVTLIKMETDGKLTTSQARRYWPTCSSRVATRPRSRRPRASKRWARTRSQRSSTPSSTPAPTKWPSTRAANRRFSAWLIQKVRDAGGDPNRPRRPRPREKLA